MHVVCYVKVGEEPLADSEGPDNLEDSRKLSTRKTLTTNSSYWTEMTSDYLRGRTCISYKLPYSDTENPGP